MAELLTGKVALVTGAAHPRGIGQAIANALNDNGATVVVTDLDGAEGLTQQGGLACDVTVAAETEHAVATVLQAHGHLDILVNNAGVGIGASDFLEITDKEWDISVAVNLRGIVNMCRAAIPHMQANGGTIINVASLAGLGALEAIPACYTASKFAAVGLTKQLAAQYADSGIRVNAICPGSVITQMHTQAMTLLAQSRGISMEQAMAEEEAGIPLGRSAQPSEIGATAVYLASDLASYVTGVALPVTGGMTQGL